MFKNNITTVSVLPENSKKSIFSIPLKYDNINESEALPNKFASVPIYKEKAQYVQKRTLNSIASGFSNNDDSKSKKSSSGDGASSAGKSYELKHFVEVKEFSPRNLVEELFDISITGFNDLNAEVIEQILLVFTGDDVKIKWTFLDDVEEKVVFLRVLDTEDLSKSSQKLRHLLQLDRFDFLEGSLRVSAEPKTREFLDDTLGKDEEGAQSLDGATKAEIAKKVQSLIQSYGHKTSKGHIDELDYVIDENELKGLPLDQLPQLRKDIKEFRLKVLENERRKREKDSQEEIKRSKQQLRKLFEKSRNDGESLDIDEDEEDEDEEDDEMSDERFEELRIQKENSDMLESYAVRVESVRMLEHRNRELLELFERYSSYEDRLDKSLKSEYEKGKFKPSNRDKLYEAQRDEEDRAKQAQEAEVNEQMEDHSSTVNIPIKVNLVAVQEDNEQEDEDFEEGEAPEVTEADIIPKEGDLPIADEKLDQVLEKVKPEIESYIEEFLGVKEDELLEYILMIIKDTKSKDALIEELTETFDEDAVKIGDKIWRVIIDQGQ